MKNAIHQIPVSTQHSNELVSTSNPKTISWESNQASDKSRSGKTLVAFLMVCLATISTLTSVKATIGFAGIWLSWIAVFGLVLLIAWAWRE